MILKDSERQEMERRRSIRRRETLIRYLKTAPVVHCATCAKKFDRTQLVHGECEACRNR